MSGGYTAKNTSKGATLSIGGSGVFVGVAGLTDISVSGKKSKTTDGTTLDGGVFELNDPTGFATPPTIKASGFYDHSSYAALEALIAAPAPTSVAVSYPAAGGSSTETFTGTGFGVDKKMSVNKLQMADIEIVTSGAPS
jgi:hypothetical protein